MDILTHEVNIKIIKYFQSFANPTMDKLAQGITMMGETYFFVIAIAIIFWCINKKLGYRLGFTLILSMVFNGLVKEILKVPRVFGTEGIRSLRVETATGYSFPSGHTQGITTFAGVLMTNIKKRWMYMLGTLLIILVGISRIYLGVHRPIDILGGIILGATWVWIGNKMFNDLEDGGSIKPLLFIIALMCICLYFFRVHDYYVATGVLVGMFGGYLIERKYINFQEKATLSKNLIKFFLGIGTVSLIQLVLKYIFPEYLIFDFIRYAITGLCITAGVPFLFIRFKICKSK